MTSDFIALPGGPSRANTAGGSGGSPPRANTGCGWAIWRGMVLRGAGFGVREVERLADTELAEAADQALARAAGARRAWPRPDELADYDLRFTAAVRASSATVEQVFAEPLFREALTWQNPGLVRICLDHLGADGKDRRSKLRKQEAVISSYLQRYATKNDSIGFFGPVGWAQWAPGDRQSTLRAGPALLRRREVYFETWAIDEVAAALASRPGLAQAIAPRRSPACFVEGNRIWRPNGSSELVSEDWARILARCDGRQPPGEIAAAIGRPEPWLHEQLALMCKAGLVRMDLSGPIEARPELRLAERLSLVPDPAASGAALADLAGLVRAKDAVSAAGGDPARLAACLAALAERFEAITGKPAAHLPGQAYAGRTVAYEDCVRDVSVSLGADVLESLGEPLALVLRSARWLTARVGEAYLRRLGERYERICRPSASWVPLGRLLAAAAPDFYIGAGTPELAADQVSELQRRWAAILPVPDGAHAHHVEPADIAAAVAEQFPASRPQWSGGLRHCPDILIDAGSVEAINRGDYQLVLGELHTAFNSVEASALVESSEEKGRLREMAAHAAGPGRIVLVPARDWGYVARTRPSADVLSPARVHWTASADDAGEVATEVIPAGALEVGRTPAGLVVRCRADGRTFALAEVIGDYLSQVVVSAFRMLPPRRHSPRISIGRLVVGRETWRLAPRFCDWAHQQDERRRFLMMRQWVARHGLPRRVFCSVPGEGKPVYVDFTSIPLTNSLATMLRRLGRDDATPVTFAEMLPGPDGCWLRDARGEAFVSELRLVATERTGE